MRTPEGREPEGAALIRAMFAAHNEGRLEDLLRLVDPGVVWEPATRPGRSYYLGKDATVALFSDIRAAYGEHHIDCHEFEQLEDGQIKVVGSVVRTAPGADPPVVAFTTLVTIRDGLVAGLVSLPADVHGAGSSEPGPA